MIKAGVRFVCVLILFLPIFSFAEKVSEGAKFKYEKLLQRKDVIWGFDFLPDGKIIFTERSGKINLFNPANSSVQEVRGAPQVWAQGQGGMLDVRVHPTKKNEIYITYSSPQGNGGTTAFGYGVLEGAQLTRFKEIFRAHSESKNGEHFGSRIDFDGQGHVFITVGDRNERPRVQDLSYHMGKVLRFNEDGSVPADNPFIKTKNAKPEIWAVGIRSPQGLFYRPDTQELWLAEMGPRGGDELNLIQKGKNYGWPVITYGREYWGPKIGEGTHKKGMEQPVVYWVPSISPSAMTFYTGDAFPEWKNNIFLATLSGQHLRRLVLRNNRVISQEELLKNMNLRFRNVRTGPDGALYFSTDDGQIARLVANDGEIK